MSTTPSERRASSASSFAASSSSGAVAPVSPSIVSASCAGVTTPSERRASSASSFAASSSSGAVARRQPFHRLRELRRRHDTIGEARLEARRETQALSDVPGERLDLRPERLEALPVPGIEAGEGRNLCDLPPQLVEGLSNVRDAGVDGSYLLGGNTRRGAFHVGEDCVDSRLEAADSFDEFVP